MERARWAPVVALLVLAPWAAEASWGGFPVTWYPLLVLFLGPLYGGAAVLIREAARRSGGGWPVIVLLAAAFGVVQAGLVDQSLFNPGFLDDTEFAGSAPGFAEKALDYVGNHVLLSICAPIMLVEAFFRDRRPWLGSRGLAGVGVLYLLGSLMIFADDEDGRKGFMLSPAQAGLAVAVIVVLVGVALLPRWRRTPRPGVGWVPHPLLFGSVLLAVHIGLWFAAGRLGVGVRVTVVVAAVVLVPAWSRRAGWSPRHVVAGWSAGLIAAAAGAVFAPAYVPTSALLGVVSDVVVVLLAVTLTAVAYRASSHGVISAGSATKAVT
ncbi:hypothetical protein Aca07nite_73210 [Actinoplanes capillaceus]|uniref:Uncharacterized protein n=1 Tax=Actinoplanes campanulatus TaxID=113559 RepID=A0ABQ3WUS3_9ACTN|nr:hypothetical protein [Actinoplanes capillaceus]GID50046.1 hypothetical protein Aca07nite_73210 [Actinoplanes capillaceus]